MTRMAAVILAGGRAERLGGLNKALLEVGGTRLVDRALAAARDCAPILLATGRHAFDVAGARAVLDLESDYAGPIAGLAAAVAALAEDPPELLFSLAVDTPFFPLDFVTRALPLAGQASAVLAAFGEQDYPTNAVWRFEVIATLPADLREGRAPRSLRRLAAGLWATHLDYAGMAADDPFANANTTLDLEALQARARGEKAG